MFVKASARAWVGPVLMLVITGSLIVASVTQAQEPAITFAAIGDYGSDSASHSQVATMIDGWDPDFIITVGDNRYDVADNDPVVGRR